MEIATINKGEGTMKRAGVNTVCKLPNFIQQIDLNFIQLFDIPIYVKDKDLKIIALNNAFIEVFGYSKEMLIGNQFCEIYPDTEHQYIAEKIEREVFETGKSSTHVLECETVSNTTERVIITTSLIGEYILSMLQLRDSVNNTYIRKAKKLTLIFDENFKILQINGSEDILNIPESELLGTNTLNLASSKYRKLIEDTLKTISPENKVVVILCPVKTKSKVELFEFTISGIFGNDQNLIYYSVTGKKHTETHKKHWLVKFSDLFELHSKIVCCTDSIGYLTYCNSRFNTFFNVYKNEEILHLNDIHKDLAEFLDRYKKQKQNSHENIHLCEGISTVIEWNIMPVKNGHFTEYLIIGTDVTATRLFNYIPEIEGLELKDFARAALSIYLSKYCNRNEVKNILQNLYRSVSENTPKYLH